MLSDPLALATSAATSAHGRRPRSVSRAQALQQAATEVPQHALQQLIKLMPKVSRPSWSGALVELVLCVSLFASSILLFTHLPWFLVPLAWLVAGGALSAGYAIGRDCAYGCYTPSHLVNRIVGELVFLPLSQPFELFRIRHVELSNNKQQHTTFMDQLKQQQEQEQKQKQAAPTNTNNNSSSKPISRSPSGNHLAAPPVPVPVVDGMAVLFSEQASRITRNNATQIMTSAALGIVFLVLSIVAIINHAGVQGLLVYWVAPMLCCRLMFAAWQAMTQHVISMLPTEVSVTIASYHMLTLALSIRHSVDSRLMKLHEVIAYFLGRIDPVNTFILFGIPAIALYGVATVQLRLPTLIFAMTYYMLAGFGITAGYHRLWAHRSYKASRFVEIFLMLCGSAALEGSIKWWCGGHRVHHRYTDTPKDPYNAQGGFWYAHIGWMLVKPDPKNKAYADIHDLREDRLIQLQHKYYLFFGPFMAFVFPTLVCGLLWGDWMGGYFYGGAFRAVCVHHSTFCVNSVAHYFGAHTYDDDRSPRDHIITALLTFGEGYHNFHHEFPNDYRNGIRWYDYDPTKWLIQFFHLLGLTHDLKTFPANEIAKGQALMIEKNIHKQIEALNVRKSHISYPAPVSTLPAYTFAQFQSECKSKKYQWVVINNIIHDVADFIEDHPGGKTFIQSGVGQDATERFQGKTGIYKHSHAAHNLLDNMRVGRIVADDSVTDNDQH